VIRTPTVCGTPLRIEGADGDTGVAALPDGAELVDDVLPVLERLVEPGAVVADIGANVGLYTIALSRLVPDGHVFAFEPSPRTVGYLRRNLASNGVSNVTVVAEAVGAEPGELEFFDNREFSAGSMAVDNAPEMFREWLSDVKRSDGADEARGGFVRVPCTTLDAFVSSSGIERLDVVKVDTEGFDLQVLRGAHETLSRFKPAVIVEFATFALTVHAQVLPAAAIDELRAVFDRLFVVERGGGLREIVTTQDVLDLLYVNATGRPVQDLLGLLADTPLTARVEAIVRDGPAEDAPTDELQMALARISKLEQAVRLEHEEVGRLGEEVAAMQATLSWRITAPLRAVRRRQVERRD